MGEFGDLPENAMVSILLLLDCEDILAMKCVSKRWLQIASNNNSLWRKKYEMDFGEPDREDVDFEVEYRTERNLKFGEPTITDLEGHGSLVTSVGIQGSIVLSASGNIIRIWDLEAMKCVHIYDLEDTVECVALHENKMGAGLKNGRMQLWDSESKDLIDAWQGHAAALEDMHIEDGSVTSCGGDHKVKIWDTTTLECTRSFDVKDPYRLHIDGDHIICGMYYCHVQVLHRKDGHLYDFDVGDDIIAIKANKTHIFVSFNGGGAAMWDRATRKQDGWLVDDDWFVVVDCKAHRVYGWAYVEMIPETGHQMWDPRTRDNIWAFEQREGVTMCTSMDAGRVVEGLDSGIVRVFDFNG